MRRIGLLVGLALCLAVIGSAVAGENDYFTLNADGLDLSLLNSDEYVMSNLSSSAQGLRIVKQVSSSSELAQPVRLTLVRMDTQLLLMDKDYGYQSKQFDSGVIYLPYSTSYTTPYLITLYVGDMVYAIPYIQTQPRLSYNTGCTFGPRLRDLSSTLSNDWVMGTMLNLDTLRQTGYQQVDICAGNYYIVGIATIIVENDRLCVLPEFFSQANPEVHGLSVYLFTDCSSLSCDPLASGLPAYAAGDWISLSDASTALLYMPLSISYDPVGLNAFYYDLYDPAIQTQVSLWSRNVYGTASDFAESEPSSEDVWNAPSDFQWIEPENDFYNSDDFQWQMPDDGVVLEDLNIPAE